MTLRHLAKELAEVERNTEWINRHAYERRARLLGRLRSWYLAEIDEIDKALTDANASIYVLCAACDERIEEHRLAAAPHNEFCSGCEPGREHDAEL
jgi:RNA polymerase-binding transcription factor DksA